jgi:hypothetical protein
MKKMEQIKKDEILQQAISNCNPKYEWEYITTTENNGDEDYGWSLLIREFNGLNTKYTNCRIIWCEKYGWITNKTFENGTTE